MSAAYDPDELDLIEDAEGLEEADATVPMVVEATTRYLVWVPYGTTVKDMNDDPELYLYMDFGEQVDAWIKAEAPDQWDWGDHVYPWNGTGYGARTQAQTLPMHGPVRGCRFCSATAWAAEIFEVMHSWSCPENEARRAASA